jgi:hypothetical protein
MRIKVKKWVGSCIYLWKLNKKVKRYDNIYEITMMDYKKVCMVLFSI